MSSEDTDIVNLAIIKLEWFNWNSCFLQIQKKRYYPGKKLAAQLFSWKSYAHLSKFISYAYTYMCVCECMHAFFSVCIFLCV